MKQLFEVLHYYIGCLVYDSFNDVVVELTPMAYAGYMSHKPAKTDEDLQIKPLLFPLSTMTREQMYAMCKLYSPEIWGDYRYNKWKRHRDPKSNDKDWIMYEIRRSVDKSFEFNVDLIDGQIKLWEDQHIMTVYNQNYRFEYLRMRFDIFDLIENKKAIDATTFKHKTYDHASY